MPTTAESHQFLGYRKLAVQKRWRVHLAGYFARFAVLNRSGNTGIQWLKVQMPAGHESLLERITTDSDVRFGKPCIRGHRITVQEILEWLSSGASPQQILEDYPQLEPDDFLAVCAYAAELAAGNTISRG